MITLFYSLSSNARKHIKTTKNKRRTSHGHYPIFHIICVTDSQSTHDSHMITAPSFSISKTTISQQKTSEPATVASSNLWCTAHHRLAFPHKIRMIISIHCSPISENTLKQQKANDTLHHRIIQSLISFASHVNDGYCSENARYLPQL